MVNIAIPHFPFPASAMSTETDIPRTTSPITAASTVDAVIAAVPAATAILNAHNIDTCCGGRASLGDAAAHAHVELPALITLLTAGEHDGAAAAVEASPPAKSCSCGCR